MPQGSPPGRARGRPKGAKNKKKINERDALNNALKIALLELGKDKIVEMSPAQILRFAMHVAAVFGDGLAAVSFAEKAAPYFDPKLTSSTLDVNTKRNTQDYSDDELERLADTPLLLEDGSVTETTVGVESGAGGEGRIIEAEVSTE